MVGSRIKSGREFHTEPEISPVKAESNSVDKSASLFESSVAAETIPFELVDRTDIYSTDFRRI